MVFKHGINIDYTTKQTADRENLIINEIECAEFDSPKLALAGIISLINAFASTTRTIKINAIALYDQSNISTKELLGTVIARLTSKVTGKTFDFSISMAMDGAPAYATQHSALKTLMDNAVDTTLYSYDIEWYRISENPDYVPS